MGFKVDAMRPHNLPFVLLGVGLLWFGWFGFNAGSALAANGVASAIFLNTLVAGCLGMLGWLSVEQIRDGKPTTFGAASGVVAGLVAITPSCGTVNTLGAAVVGMAAGVVCSFAIGVKFRLNYDDSLDVVGVHFVGGVVGVLLIGVLATEVMTGGPSGLFYGGGLAQLGKQALAMVVVSRLRVRACPTSWPQSSTGPSASGSARRTRPAAWTSPSTPRPPTPRVCTATSSCGGRLFGDRELPAPRRRRGVSAAAVDRLGYDSAHAVG